MQHSDSCSATLLRFKSTKLPLINTHKFCIKQSNGNNQREKTRLYWNKVPLKAITDSDQEWTTTWTPIHTSCNFYSISYNRSLIFEIVIAGIEGLVTCWHLQSLSNTFEPGISPVLVEWIKIEHYSERYYFENYRSPKLLARSFELRF
jgi:hypothetical protein